MKQFVFDSTEEFKSFFSGRNLELTEAIVDGIRMAVQQKKRSAELFEVMMQGLDDAYEIGLPSGEWPKALSNCLKHFEEAEMYDEAIDTFQLLKEVTEKY